MSQHIGHDPVMSHFFGLIVYCQYWDSRLCMAWYCSVYYDMVQMTWYCKQGSALVLCCRLWQVTEDMVWPEAYWEGGHAESAPPSHPPSLHIAPYSVALVNALLHQIPQGPRNQVISSWFANKFLTSFSAALAALCI